MTDNAAPALVYKATFDIWRCWGISGKWVFGKNNLTCHPRTSRWCWVGGEGGCEWWVTNFGFEELGKVYILKSLINLLKIEQLKA